MCSAWFFLSQSSNLADVRNAATGFSSGEGKAGMEGAGMIFFLAIATGKIE
jgi:hypothetical protein